MRILHFFLYGQWMIAVCAAAQTAQTALLGQVSAGFYVAFTGLATFVWYNLHKPLSVFFKPLLGGHPRFQKTALWAYPLSISVLAAFLGAFFLFFQLKTATRGGLGIAALGTVAYSLPIWRGRRLRDFMGVKTALLAGVWAWVTAILPYWEAGKASLSAWELWAERFFYIFALALPFDIRDMALDKAQNTPTLPTQLGIKNTQKTAMVCLIVSFLGSLALYQAGVYALWALKALLLSNLLTAWVVWRADSNKSDVFYYIYTDGLMVVQYIICTMMAYFNPNL